MISRAVFPRAAPPPTISTSQPRVPTHLAPARPLAADTPARRAGSRLTPPQQARPPATGCILRTSAGAATRHRAGAVAQRGAPQHAPATRRGRSPPRTELRQGGASEVSDASGASGAGGGDARMGRRLPGGRPHRSPPTHHSPPTALPHLTPGLVEGAPDSAIARDIRRAFDSTRPPAGNPAASRTPSGPPQDRQGRHGAPARLAKQPLTSKKALP